jgi:Protein of unknown function (DUF3043)
MRSGRAATLHPVASLFRRKEADLVQDQAAEVDDPADEAGPVRQSRAYTPKKGEATPKRASGVVRRPEPPAANRKEALKRARTRQREERGEARERMMAGEEKYLMPRDKGPVRRLARDVVDSRRNAATFFFVGLFVVLLGTSKGFPTQVRIAANTLFLVLFAATIIDSYLIVRRVKGLAQTRFPKEAGNLRGIYFYVVMRSISFRRLRVPKPQVKVGDKI